MMLYYTILCWVGLPNQGNTYNNPIPIQPDRYHYQSRIILEGSKAPKPSSFAGASSHATNLRTELLTFLHLSFSSSRLLANTCSSQVRTGLFSESDAHAAASICSIAPTLISKLHSEPRMPHMVLLNSCSMSSQSLPKSNGLKLIDSSTERKRFSTDPSGLPDELSWLPLSSSVSWGSASSTGRFKSKGTLDVLCSRFEVLGDSCSFSWPSALLSFRLLIELEDKDTAREFLEETTTLPPVPPLVFVAPGSTKIFS
uniref:Uncharacterized protein n=1 Tax=Arundo donax TaxID=35708 RepID=A0A0A9DZD2_ARUDO